MKRIGKLIFSLLVLALSLLLCFYSMFWSQFALSLRPPLKDRTRFILGIGLPRTGSSSLTEALHILKLNPYHFPLLFSVQPEKYLAKCGALVDFSTLGYRPRQLYEMLPGAIVIHTMRDVVPWMKSMHYLRQLLLLSPCIRRKFDEIYGPETNWARFHELFEKEAKSIPNALHWDLCNEPRWEVLCKFLGKEIPLQSFPHKKELSLQLQQILGMR
jgi:hypothetical protein